ncbi:MAG TPA: hypothetical protein VGK36_08915 [Candidatus Angelobacter sp.]|jgi:hypothetical protein
MFKKIGTFFKNLWNETPKWSESVSTGIILVAPLANTIVAMVAPDEVPLVQNVVSQVKSGLAAAAKFASDAHGSDAAPAGLITTLEAVKSNLGDLLTAGHIKNADTLTKVTAVANSIIGEVEAILEVVPKGAALSA